MPRSPEFFQPPIAKSSRPPEPGDPGYVSPTAGGAETVPLGEGGNDPWGEYKEFVPEAEKFVEDYKYLFASIAGDPSLSFKVGHGFFIDLQKGVVTLDIKDWQWAKNKGLSNDQLLWSVSHEIAHFRDLREAPQEMLANFEYLEQRARELEPQVLEIWRNKLGGQLPEYLTQEVPVSADGKRKTSYARSFIYRRMHMLYNSLDDMYVNLTIGERSAQFREPGAARKGGSKHKEVRRLYRDYLFPTDPKKIGEPPQELQAADYEKIPKSYQLANALLRRRMVSDQEILLSPEVREALRSFADTSAERRGLTLEKEVDHITRIKAESRKPGWRYKRIKESVEPKFIELFLKDLEELDPPPPPQKGKPGKPGGQGGESVPGGPPTPGGQPQTGEKPGQPGEGSEGSDPWKENDDKPEHIDLDKIRDFIKQQKTQNKEKEKNKKSEEEKKRLTPDERADQALKEHDRDVAKKFELGADGARAAKEYRELEKSIEPYKKDLAQVFEMIMKTIQERIAVQWAQGYKSGKFNIERFIRKYGPELATGEIASIPWEGLDVYDQREYTQRLQLFPDSIRVRLVFDGSGSMNEERVLAVKQLATLMLESMSTFEATINARFKLKNPFVVDTEIWMFGDPGRSKLVKPFAHAKMTPDEELADRFKAFSKISGDYGGTCEAEPHWKIAETIDSKRAEQLKRGMAKEFVFEITDGGTNMVSAYGQPASPEPRQEDYRKLYRANERAAVQDSANALARLQKLGVVARAFQIGNPARHERAVFKLVWGKDGEEIPHPKDLAPSVAKLLAAEITKTQFEVAQYEEPEDEGLEV